MNIIKCKKRIKFFNNQSDSREHCLRKHGIVHIFLSILMDCEFALDLIFVNIKSGA